MSETGALRAEKGDSGASRNFVYIGSDRATEVKDAAGSAQGRVEVDVEGDFRVNNARMKQIFDAVAITGVYNYSGAKVPIPSGLNVEAWKRYLQDYRDPNIVQYLEFGWPINFDREQYLVSTFQNHKSARDFPADIEHYIKTELGFAALVGPFEGPPVVYTHLSPLMTRPKKDASFRRVIMDLSWPDGASINDGVDSNIYVDGPARITLPTVDFMEARLLSLGRGAYMYKTDLARGYRQLRVDPNDWPLLGFQHQGKIYIDVCPPFGLKSSAMCMQRTTDAISYMHGKAGYVSRPYLDDFGGAEAERGEAEKALQTLQTIMKEIGVVEAEHKICQPSQTMIWLGILFDSVNMTMTIPPGKLREIMTTLREWQGRTHATHNQMQSVLGLLQFVASVSPPTRIFTNRMLQNLRDTPKRGAETLSAGFKKDLEFFNNLLPDYNGVKIMDKVEVECQGLLELDACLVGCGAYVGNEYYSELFPVRVVQEEHMIAHLEMLNVVVALKTWAERWRGQRIRVHCDNTNTCLAIQTGRSKDVYMQGCIRELFMYMVRYDVELAATHRPGTEMRIADALSRAANDRQLRYFVDNEPALRRARRLRIKQEVFDIVNKM